MNQFDAETLRHLREAREVSIRTDKHPNGAVVIWVVVAGDDVFVRSVSGARGRWHRDLETVGQQPWNLAAIDCRCTQYLSPVLVRLNAYTATTG